jgi:hypothetical protein
MRRAAREGRARCGFAERLTTEPGSRRARRQWPAGAEGMPSLSPKHGPTGPNPLPEPGTNQNKASGNGKMPPMIAGSV